MQQGDVVTGLIAAQQRCSFGPVTIQLLCLSYVRLELQSVSQQAPDTPRSPFAVYDGAGACDGRPLVVVIRVDDAFVWRACTNPFGTRGAALMMLKLYRDEL